MAEKRKHVSRRGRAAVAVIAVGAIAGLTACHSAPAGPQDPVVSALAQAAHPLRSTEPGADTGDLRELGAMAGEATVVGLGEATHGSHEFFTMKQRVFRYLVQEKGFTTFALELSWSAGLEIDDYLQTGKGDARTVAKDTLTGSPWDREEFVELIQWMRDYNSQHPGHTVHFMGDDIGAPSLDDEFFGRVTDYVQRNHPESLTKLDELYTGLRPIDDAIAFLGRPLPERQRLATQAQQALDLISGLKGSGGDEFDRAEQNARNIAQTAEFLTVDTNDQGSLADSERFRDQVMAGNVTWWQQHNGGKVLLSAHDDHVGYVAGDPKTYPKTQGSFLRDTMGAGYLAIGSTFDRGSFLSKDTALGGEWKKFTVGAAASGSNEYTLDQVHYPDYYLDMRTAPAAARSWLDVPRPTRQIGTEFPVDPEEVALGRSYDVLVQLHEVHEAEQRKP
ncbi:erythromycin esterase family protein [Nocardia sp. NPDC088792]|uniref:erythromycin esterase family protein n=1 Tax=Nocardia sp. NPDC088792 TaxID=3364332 RepID=UPI00382BF8CE